MYLFLTAVRACLLGSMVITLAACGKSKNNSGGGGTPAPQVLNQAQKDRFSATMVSLGRTQEAARVAHGTQGGNRGGARDRVHRPELSVQPNRTPDQTSREMADFLAQAQCDITMTEPPNDPNAGSMQFGLSVKGPTCPVAMDMAFAMQMGQTSQSATMSFKYDVKDEAFRKLNDVDGVQLNASMNSQFTGNQTSFNLTGQVQGDGTIRSQSEGPIRVVIGGGSQGHGTQNSYVINSTMIVSFHYSDGMRVELKEANTVHGGPNGEDKTSTYYLNGERISKQQYDDYVGSIGLGGDSESMLR